MLHSLHPIRSEMGAEQSVDKTRPGLSRALRSFAGNNHLASQASSNANPSRHNSVTRQLAQELTTRQGASEALSEELRLFLKEKQEEFLGLVQERRRLKIEIMANDVANNSILEAFTWFFKESREHEVKFLAEVLAWKSIALGAGRILHDNENTSLPIEFMI